MNTPKPIYINDPELVAQRDALLALLEETEQAMTRSASTGAVYLSELQQLLPRVRDAIAAVESCKVPT